MLNPNEINAKIASAQGWTNFYWYSDNAGPDIHCGTAPNGWWDLYKKPRGGEGHLPSPSTRWGDAMNVVDWVHREWIFSKRQRFLRDVQVFAAERNKLTCLPAWPSVWFFVQPIDICNAFLKVGTPAATTEGGGDESS